MKITKSIKVHAVDQNKNQALCGMVMHLKPEKVNEGHYLDVTCLSCQWILNNEITSLYEKKPDPPIYQINKKTYSMI